MLEIHSINLYPNRPCSPLRIAKPADKLKSYTQTRKFLKNFDN